LPVLTVQLLMLHLQEALITQAQKIALAISMVVQLLMSAAFVMAVA
jgi:hypothetical protein